MNISIFGLGYVGCVGMGCLASQGHKIIGVDVSDKKVELINQGVPTIVEKENCELSDSEIIKYNNYIGLNKSNNNLAHCEQIKIIAFKNVKKRIHSIRLRINPHQQKDAKGI